MPIDADARLARLSQELRDELTGDILPFWSRYRDDAQGGFFGNINNDGSFDADAPKGLVMHTRLLWTYAQALIDGYQVSTRQGEEISHRDQAEHAYKFLRDRLADKTNGGFHWFVPAAASAEPSHSHRDIPGLPEAKIVYGQAFAVYALSTWFRASGEKAAMELALNTFDLIEKTARDREYGGYWEGVGQDWSAPCASALGAEDPRVEKSMNTNLHVMEAWTALHLALKQAGKWLSGRDLDLGSRLPEVAESLGALVHIHADRIRVRPGHLGLYFSRDWSGEHPVESYGHDVEASWLIAEAAEELWGHAIPAKIRDCVIELAAAGAEILDRNDGSMPNESHGAHIDLDRIWWVQAESMVAMVNLWQLDGDPAHIGRAVAIWEYVKRHIVDRENGEWFWGRQADGLVMPGRQKGGMWKANYHNGRACMEIIRRANSHRQ